MILVGNQRGGSADLAQHLLKDENDHVTVHELRGFASDTLPEALNEAYAISRGTQCQKFLFSLSLNPPEQAQVSTEDFESAVEGIEDRLGLSGQPRAIVFHEKEGRRHCHAVWSRIDANEMKARKLGLYKRTLNDCARNLYLEHGWDLPPGMRNPVERDPRNFTLEQWQQAKRVNKDPRQIKTDFQQSWQASDSLKAFTSAIEERGYKLAKGDRRGHVAVDMHGEVYSIARMTGVKTKAVRARLGEPDELPSVDQCKAEFAQSITGRLQQLHDEQERKRREQEEKDRKAREQLVREQREARRRLIETQQARQDREVQIRQARYNRGLRGLVDRFTGKHAKVRAQNEAETLQAQARDASERDKLIFQHIEQRKALRAQTHVRQEPHQRTKHELREDMTPYRDWLPEARRERLDAFRAERARSIDRERGPDRGPNLEP